MITAALVDGVRGLVLADAPDEARVVARHCLLDWLGCALAGSGDPLVDILVAETAAREHAHEASILGRGGRATAATAALVNGAAGHALDYDDTHTTMMGHPSAPVIPAALAVAELEGASGQRLLDAIVAGIELECRLGAMLGGGHYAAGFHATATVGAFGAATAVARLLGLERDAWLDAFGLAGTQAAGLKASFGTMAKPLHAGRAAAIGLEAALLARRGFRACRDIVEAPQGFAATHAASSLDEAFLRAVSGRWFVRDTLFKFHAACYLTHAAIDAATVLRDGLGVAPHEMESVEVRVAPTALGVCNIAEPKTGLELKFSLRAAVAMALRGDDTSAPGSFRDEVAADAKLAALRDRVRVIGDEALAPTEAVVRVEARDSPGAAVTAREARADSGRPAADLGAQQKKLEAKFLALAAPVVGADRAGAAMAAVAGIEDAPGLRALLAALTPE